MSGSSSPQRYAGLGVLVSPLFTLVLGLPALVILLPLRFAKLASWTIEAVARPWGRRGPAEVMHWSVKGWSESKRVLDELCEALRRGENSPRIAGAQREE